MIALHLIKTTVGASWALKQIEVLVGLGCCIHVVLPEDSGLADAYRAAGAHIHVLNVDIAQVKSPLSFIRSALKLRKLVREIGPDIVHSHFVGTTLFMRMALWGMGIARVFQVPGPLHLESTITRNAEIMLATAKDYWIATCARTRKYYLDAGIADNRIFSTFYGTDVSRFSPGVKGYLRSQLGLAPGVKIIGMVAYVYPPKKWLGQERGIKGHEDLIDAGEIVFKSRDDVVLVFVGGAWGKSEDYYSSVLAYGKARLGEKGYFLGTRSDVSKIYPDFDLVVHPSHSENLGGAAESLLMGVPTIATNIGGFPDIVLPGKTGWLVPAHNPAAMAAAILEVLNNPEEASRRSVAGRLLAEKELDVKKTASDVYSFYKSILSH